MEIGDRRTATDERLTALQDMERRLVREGLAATLAEAESDGNDGRRGELPYGEGWRSNTRRPSGGRNPEPARTFTVTVLGLETTEIRRIGGGPHASLIQPDAALARLLERTAVRTLYVLGWAQGQVELAIGGGRAVVRRVSAFPEPSAGIGERLFAAAAMRQASQAAAEAGRPPVATLGADPEFVLLSPEGRIVPASRYFPPGDAVGSDSVVVRGVRRWPLAELRPAPANEPNALAAALRRLLAAASLRVGDAPLIWRAGALPVPGLPLGGHIHLSGVAPTAERLRALDNAVALPLRLLEPPGAARRRPRYGALGDFRRKAHGGFEYRTPPSWLVSPALACGVLALAKVAAEEPGRIARPLDDDRVRDAFYGDGGDLLAAAVREVMGSVRRTEGYARYERWILPLFRAIESGKSWDDTADLRDRWRVRG